MTQVIGIPRKKANGEWNTHTKNRALSSYEAGWSKGRIRRDYGIYSDTMQKWLQQRDPRRTGKARTGRPRILTVPHTKWALKWTLCQGYLGRKSPFAYICRQLSLPCSPKTLKRHFADLGYFKCKACPKPYITEATQLKRLAFERLYEACTHAWKRAHFSDECTFVMAHVTA